MEATRVREEWEHAISSKENANSQPNDEDASSDAYCFELLSMVLALSGSNVGRQYLAQQLTLLQDLFSLLHTASPRVQRQVWTHLSFHSISLFYYSRNRLSKKITLLSFYFSSLCYVYYWELYLTSLTSCFLFLTHYNEHKEGQNML